MCPRTPPLVKSKFSEKKKISRTPTAERTQRRRRTPRLVEPQHSKLHQACRRKVSARLPQDPPGLSSPPAPILGLQESWRYAKCMRIKNKISREAGVMTASPGGWLQLPLCSCASRSPGYKPFLKGDTLGPLQCTSSTLLSVPQNNIFLFAKKNKIWRQKRSTRRLPVAGPTRTVETPTQATPHSSMRTKVHKKKCGIETARRKDCM